MDETGISLQISVIRSSGLRLLALRARTVKVNSHFKYRIVTLWNDLPLSIVSILLTFSSFSPCIATSCQKKSDIFHGKILKE